MNQNKPKSKKSTREEVERKPYVKATTAQIEARIESCFNFLLLGTPRKEIVRYVTKTEGCEWREVYRYIEAAYEQIRNSPAVDKEYEIARELLRRDALYQKAILKGDVRSALAVCDSRCELLGLFAPQKIDLVDKRQNPYASLNKEEAIIALAELETLKARTGPRLVPSPKDQGKRRTG